MASWVEEGVRSLELKCFLQDLRVRLSQVRCSYISNHSYTDYIFELGLQREADESKDKHKKDNEAREFRRKDRRRWVALLHHNFV